MLNFTLVRSKGHKKKHRNLKSLVKDVEYYKTSGMCGLSHSL